MNPDTGRPLPIAFTLRANETGLSVGLTYDAAISGLSKSYGAATLHVGRLRDSGLDVEHCPTDRSQDHGEIVGVPDPQTDLASSSTVLISW